MLEKRSEHRKAINYRVDVLDSNRQALVSKAARICNLSPGGFCLESEDPLLKNGSYIFKVFIDVAMPIELGGQIVQMKRDYFSQTSGVKIQPPAFNQRSLWNHFLSSHFPEVDRKFKIYTLLVGTVILLACDRYFGLPIPASALCAALGMLIIHLWKPF